VPASLHQQVDYRHDEDWNNWNLAAKKRILLNDESNLNYQPIRAPPLAECCVSLRRVSGSATQVSSIGSDNSRFSSKGSSHARDSVAASLREDDTDATTVAMMRDDNRRFSSQSSDATTVAMMRGDSSRFSSQSSGQSSDATTVAMMREDSSRFSSQSSCHTRDSDEDTLARMREDNSNAATLARENATFLAMMAKDEEEAREKAKRREVPAVTVNSKTLQKEERDAARKEKEKAVREGVACIALLALFHLIASLVSFVSFDVSMLVLLVSLLSTTPSNQTCVPLHPLTPTGCFKKVRRG
jgi:hypothetical protein